MGEGLSEVGCKKGILYFFLKKKQQEIKMPFLVELYSIVIPLNY